MGKPFEWLYERGTSAQFAHAFSVEDKKESALCGARARTSRMRPPSEAAAGRKHPITHCFRCALEVARQFG